MSPTNSHHKSVGWIKISKAFSLIILGLLFVGPACADYAQPQGGNWLFDADSQTYPFILNNGHREGDPFVPCNVVAHASNEKYIIAAQKPDTECRWREKDAKFAETSNMTGNSVNYWIIDVGADRVIGPLSMNEYFQQRQQLNIPDDLIMDVKI